MKKLFLLPLLLLSLISNPCLSETMASLVERDGIYYKKFTETPFTGKVTGVIQGRLKDGKKEGKWTMYHPNGQLMNKVSYKKGKKEGISVWYHDNGQLMGKENYKNGGIEGEVVSFLKNGQLQEKGSYKNGKKEGKWVEFFQGRVFKWGTGTFKDGKKVSD